MGNKEKRRGTEDHKVPCTLNVSGVCTKPFPRFITEIVIRLTFKEHPSWESVLRRLAESESRPNVETFNRLRRNLHRRAKSVGGRQTLTTTTMSNTTQFSLANRKHLADMLADKYDGLRSKVKRQWRDKRDVLRESLIKDHAEKKGASPILKQVDAAQRKLHEMTLELRQLGFELCDSGLQLAEENTNPLDKIIDSEIKKAIGTENDIDARFDSAQVAMMTVATLLDAQQLLKSVQEV